MLSGLALQEGLRSVPWNPGFGESDSNSPQHDSEERVSGWTIERMSQAFLYRSLTILWPCLDDVSPLSLFKSMILGNEQSVPWPFLANGFADTAGAQGLIKLNRS